jgi:hypothetical protein
MLNALRVGGTREERSTGCEGVHETHTQDKEGCMQHTLLCGVFSSWGLGVGEVGGGELVGMWH